MHLFRGRRMPSHMSHPPATAPPARSSGRFRALTGAVALVAASVAVAAMSPSAAAEPPVDTQDVEIQADVQTVLPKGDATDVLIDDAHQQIFVAMTNPAAILVTGFDGTVSRTLTGLTAPKELSLSEDGTTVYVVERASAVLRLIDTQTYEITTVSLPPDHCAMSAVPAGGKLWYSFGRCSSTYQGGIGIFDPLTGQAVDSGLTAKPGMMRAVADRPDRLFLAETMDSGGRFQVFDVSGESPVKIATGGQAFCSDTALIAGGDQVVAACGGLNAAYRVFNTADLTSGTPVPGNGDPLTMAVSNDGSFLATGDDGGSYPDGPTISVYNIENGTPGTLLRTYEYSYYTWLRTGSFSISDAGQLVAITEDVNGTRVETLHILDNATKYDTSITVTAPKSVDYDGILQATGTLNKGPGVATTLTLTRTDKTGTHDMGTVPVAADGTFSFSHKSTVLGSVVYKLVYAGDDTHQPTQLDTEVFMRVLPFDVNGDGYAETVVGSPGENIGADENTGLFHVLPGKATGATGTGSKSYEQETPGVPGAGEDGDNLGFANTSGDFNADGYADVAVSSPAENVGSLHDAGNVLVFYGSANGLRTTGITSLENKSYEDAYFGHSLAAGDFDGDGQDDLAVGMFGSYAGHVMIYHGTPSGISTAAKEITQDTWDVPGYNGENDLFGWSVAAGDINGDGRDDLAVGAIYDWEDKDWSTGSATVLYGSDQGLTGTGSQRFTKDTPGVPGSPGSFNPSKGDASDQFGYTLALADFNGDGKDDLAVGAAGAPTAGADGSRKANAGTVTVLYSDGTKLSTAGVIQLTQLTGALPSSPGTNDFFGSTLAAGDANGDGKAELAIYSPGDTFVTVVPGASGGLATTKAKGWTQNSQGVPGATESGDGWGGSLRFSDVKGGGYDALIIGADGENNGSGMVTLLYSTGSGLTATGSKSFSQDSTGIPGGAESGDGFGVFF